MDELKLREAEVGLKIKETKSGLKFFALVIGKDTGYVVPGINQWLFHIPNMGDKGGDLKWLTKAAKRAEAELSGKALANSDQFLIFRYAIYMIEKLNKEMPKEDQLEDFALKVLSHAEFIQGDVS